MRIDGGAYLSESISDGGEVIAGEGVIIDVTNLDAVIAALIVAKRELTVVDAAAE